jgi:putative transposase
LEVLHQPRFCDLPPAQVWARLLDEGTYLASISTMYRLLRAHGESRDRRRQRTHPATAKPQLLARKPNDVWSWDIIKLPGPSRHEFYDLYVILDIYSRYAPGWLVALASPPSSLRRSSLQPSPASEPPPACSTPTGAPR